MSEEEDKGYELLSALVDYALRAEETLEVKDGRFKDPRKWKEALR